MCFVERTCREANDYPLSLSPPIQALIHNRRGWVYDGLFGAFLRAGREFRAAERLAREAGDARLVRECGHFGVRVLTEETMTHAGAWLTARSQVKISGTRAATLDRIINSEEWKAVLRDGDPHHYRFLFNLLALIRPEDAAKLLGDRGSLLASAPVLHMLSSARWHASDHAWGYAIATARDASEEYYALRHPFGIAHAAAITAYAYRCSGLRTRKDMAACLDAWICALRLHPFETHPLWRSARRGLADTVHDGERDHADWLAQYTIELPDRLRERRDTFHVFSATDTALGPVPSLTASLGLG